MIKAQVNLFYAATPEKLDFWLKFKSQYNSNLVIYITGCVQLINKSEFRFKIELEPESGLRLRNSS